MYIYIHIYTYGNSNYTCKYQTLLPYDIEGEDVFQFNTSSSDNKPEYHVVDSRATEYIQITKF